MKIVDIIVVSFSCTLLIVLTFAYIQSYGDDMIGSYAGGVGGFISVYMVLYFFGAEVQQVKQQIRLFIRKK